MRIFPHTGPVVPFGPKTAPRVPLHRRGREGGVEGSSSANAPRREPDWFLIGQLPDRLPDRGPRYAETPPDPHAPDAPVIAEPFNAATAALFIVIVGYWVIRLRGRYSRFPFLISCLPILLVGGIGGTLYHAFRTRPLYFFLDVVPISFLGLAGALYLTFRLGRWHGWVRVGAYGVGAVVVYLAINLFIFRVLRFDQFPNLPVNLSYASLAVVVLIPLLGVMVYTKFRWAAYVWAGLACFGIAFFCRLVDGTPYGALPMGTHWLWHLFGAACTQFLIAYFYRLEGERGEPATSTAETLRR
jgi:hypothetical protein